MGHVEVYIYIYMYVSVQQASSKQASKQINNPRQDISIINRAKLKPNQLSEPEPDYELRINWSIILCTRAKRYKQINRSEL